MKQGGYCSMLDYSKFTRDDNEALDEKANNPNSAVKCPRCGKLLIFTRMGNSYIIQCETSNCLHDECRGL
jgi:hypothetical protein